MGISNVPSLSERIQPRPEEIASPECSSYFSFPAHERILASGDGAALERLETMLARLDHISRKGAAAERIRAQTARTACQLTRDLLYVIVESREKLAAR